MRESFEWDEDKNRENQEKHGVSFEQAQFVIIDPDMLILRDDQHSTSEEERFFAVGQIQGGVLTVRFTMRERVIRIFGAGFWRKYRARYLDHK